MRRRARALVTSIASLGALILLATVATVAYADDDAPLTAADVAPSIVETAPAAKFPPGAGTASEPPAAESATAVDADSGEVPGRPTFTMPAVAPIDHVNDAPLPPPEQGFVTPPATQEIPQAIAPEDPVGMVSPNTVPSSTDLSNYLNDEGDLGSGVGSVRDFVAEGEETSPIGVEVRESRRRLKTGEEIDGLLILNVERNSAAARAGLRPFKHTAHSLLAAAAIVAMPFFPPSIFVLPVLDYKEIGQSYDMIIGVDGSRVTNFSDFEDKMRNLEPGELVYFNVLRNGKRLQIPVPISTLSPSASASN